MKNMWLNLIMGVIFLLSLADIVLAGDNLSMSISCTIPAIPGLNAPLIEEETSKTDMDVPVQSKTESQTEVQSPAPAMIEQDTQEEKVIQEEDQKSLVMLKTIYSR